MFLFRNTFYRTQLYIAIIQQLILCFMSFSFAIFRISEGMALEHDIHASVSEQIKKNFYKAKWKVRYGNFFND